MTKRRTNNATLHRGNSLLRVQERPEYDQLVLVKEPVNDYLGTSQIKELDNEFAITRRLAGQPGIRQVYKREGSEDHPILLLEYIQGKSLSELIQHESLELSQKLELALHIAEIIDHIHGQKVIHKDICSSNILVADDGAIYIIDFGNATMMSHEELETPVSTNTLASSLAYTSPEQTGRINRPVDYRSDIYSLGVTLYELFVRRLPFETDDALEMIHCHLAQNPTPLEEIDTAIPQPLSDIILKLLAKSAEDRYQSAQGLQTDLRICLDELLANGWVDSFELGQEDFTHQLQVSRKLYGRQDELAQLRDTLGRITLGNVEMLVVAGDAGVGKTALIHELRVTIVTEQGVFLEGKFDQSRRNEPYLAWGQAFSELVKEWLTESETSLAARREIILKHLGNNGQVLVDLIPSLERILGPQPTVPQLGGVEAKNRLHYLFLQFIRAVTSPSNPLILFLDDLQWADPASLDLLETLLSDPDGAYLLVIGAYRNREVDATHPLMSSLDNLAEAGCTVNQIGLGNLTLKRVNELLADTMGMPVNQCHSLASVVHNKTDGNAFFTHQLLKALEADGLLRFDHEDRLWRWDLDELNELKVSANVVDLMAHKITHLPAASLEAIKIAACLGNRFELNTFYLITGQSEASAEQILQPVFEESLLIKFNGSCRFAHDRIQQVAYSLIDKFERVRLHWHIGQIWFNETAPNARNEHILEIVRHLNLGSGLIETEAERLELAELNFKAAQKARNRTAYAAASDFTKTAIDLIAMDGWQINYPLMLNLYQLAAEVSYLNLDYEQSEQYIKTAIAQARSLLDRIPTLTILIQVYHNQNLLDEAIEAGLAVLDELGFTLLESEPAGITVQTIAELPSMTDPRAEAAAELLDKIILPAFVARPGLLDSVVYTALNLNLNFGLHPSSSFLLMVYAAFLCTDDFDRGYQFGLLALQIVEKSKADRYKGRVKGVFDSYILPWRSHLRKVEQALKNDVEIALQLGDKSYAMSFVRLLVILDIFVHDGLEQAFRNITDKIRQLRQNEDVSNISTMLAWAQFAANLRGKTENPLLFTGPTFEEASETTLQGATGEYQTIFYMHLFKLILHYHLGYFQAAFDYSEKAEPMLPEFRSRLLIHLLPFYQSLAILQQPEGVEQSSKLSEKLEQNLQRLHNWAQHAPMNHQHEVDLILAEKARVTGDTAAAIDHYEAAINGARNNEYLHEEALANELYGRFWVQRGNDTIARLYLRQAHILYNRWGAAAIVEHLEAQYPEWLNAKHIGADPLRPSVDVRQSYGGLDLRSVLKASQAIAGEINLDKLLTRMLGIVMENSGAQRGFLILEQDSQWLVSTGLKVGESQSEMLEDAPINKGNLVSERIVRYVIRTQRPLILGNATHDGDFASDPYIQRNQVKSLLCLPLINLGKTSGILYFENNLTADVFTAERQELLNLLSSQMAISIDHARTYDNLEKLVVERTEALTYTEEQIQALFETSPLGIAITNSEGQILIANKALLQMIGYTETEVRQLNVTKLYRDPAQRFEFLRRIQERGIERDFGIEIVRKDGTSFFASLNASTLSRPDQDVFLAVLEDISDKILTERALNDANENLVKLLDSSRKMTASLDFQPLLELILGQLAQVVGYAEAVIGIIEKDDIVIRAGQIAEGLQSLLGLRIPLDALPFINEMMIARKPIIANDFSTLPELVKELETADGQTLQEHFIPGSSVILLPLIANDQLIGIIALWKNEPNNFAPQTTELLQAFANQAAIAVDNARLYQEIQQSAVLEERERLARELHDAVTQTLFSASVIAEATPGIWATDPETGQQYLEELPRLLRGALAEMRTLLIELRPSALGEQTLGKLLELLADSARARSGTTITLQVEGDYPLSNSVILIFYRIAQESLNNIAKHAEATEVNMWLNSDGEDVSLQITDDGRGFDPTNIPPGHLGIGIMHERAREIGAAIQIDSNPGDGTLIRVTWSIKDQTL